jgi:DNA-binding NtrC family response regulator/tetratricopeptide (TPR) repeat protein
MARSLLIATTHPTERLVGQAPAIAALREQIRHLVAFDTPGNPLVPTVLLHGETGTGKGLVAQIIHESGPRAQGPFLEVNCAAIPESLLEAELFGFEAGAFTDAKRAKSGLFEAASGGTLFLDEIDALPLTLQGKLLTVIEAKRVRRLGAVVEHPIDVKLTVATQAELDARIAEGRFRADLYHRLAVILLEVPPLRERRADVVLLAQHYLQRYAEAHRLSPKRLSQKAEAWLRRYAWPGNVRELGHLMERVTLLSPDTLIGSETLAQLCLPLSKPTAPTTTMTAEADTEVADEAAQIRLALQRTAGNVARASRLSGISRGAFRHRMARYGIAPLTTEGKVVVPPPQQRAGQHEGTAARQDGNRVVPLSRESPTPAPGWEQKPVAVLAVEVIWPASNEGEVSQYEPWTVTSHWEQAIVEKVQGFGGVVLPHPPSLVVVAFGVPQTLEQAPQRVVQAALALRSLVAEAAERGPYPELRMAVHWGQVLVDTGASDPTARLLPVGGTLAWPGRLLGYVEPGEIVASSEMGQLVEGWCELRAHEELLGMGEPDQIGVYTVVGLRPLGSPLEMHGRRPLSRFVGRERELAVLGDLLGQAEEGRGQVVGIVGEPGLGKSRLCYEFMSAHPTQGWLILETSADSYGQATPYLPVIDLLKSYFQIASRDGVSALRDKVTDKLRTLGQSFESSLPAFLTLLDVPVEDSTWQALDPLQRRQRILGAIKRLLVRESQLQLILLVIENLHWIDGETQALLDTLVEGLATTRILLLVTYRPEYQHVWGSKTYYMQLRLDPLHREHAQELLDSLLGGDANLAPLMQSLLQRTEGNPFFLEESVQTLVETQVLAGEPGAYSLAKLVQNIQVPTTVHMVLAARIDRLPPEEKRLLQTAAVIGKDVPFALLQAIAERPEELVRRGLASLRAAEFLYERSFSPELGYTFKHALTHEVAYGSLLHERRLALHARIVEASEALAGERVAEQVERLAHHALRGEVWDKALAYSRQAGEKAMERSAFREALAHLEQALGASHHLPEQRDTIEQAIDLRCDLRNVLLALDEQARIFDQLHAAEALAERLDDPQLLGQIACYLCISFSDVGEHDRAIAAGQRALALAITSGAFDVQVYAQTALGSAYHRAGDFRQALDVSQRVMALLTGELRYARFGQVHLPAVNSRRYMAWSLAELGGFAEGRGVAEDAVRLAEAVSQPFSIALALMGVGLLARRQGDVHTAIPVLERGLALSQSANIPLYFSQTTPMLGAAYALAGRAAEALQLLDQVLGRVITGTHMYFHALVLTELSEACLLIGRVEEASALAGRLLELSRTHIGRGYQAHARRLLGEVAMRRDPPDVDQALAHYRQALALSEDLGMRPLQAHCHLGLGTLYAKIGRPEQAGTELSTAIELYRSMEMTFWLPQAEAALAQVDGSQ